MIYEYRKSRHAGVSERTCYARANQRTRPDPMHVVSFLCEVHLIAARAVNSVLLKKGRRKTHSRHRVCSDYRCSQSTPACQFDPFDVETTLSAMHVKLQCTYAYRSVLRESRDRTLFCLHACLICPTHCFRFRPRCRHASPCPKAAMYRATHLQVGTTKERLPLLPLHYPVANVGSTKPTTEIG